MLQYLLQFVELRQYRMKYNTAKPSSVAHVTKLVLEDEIVSCGNEMMLSPHGLKVSFKI